MATPLRSALLGTLNRERYSDTEWSLVTSGRCDWQTFEGAYGDGHCGAPAPEDHVWCGEHRELFAGYYGRAAEPGGF